MVQTAKLSSVFNNFYRSLGEKTNQAMFDSLVKASSLKPRFTFAELAAISVATVVHLVTLVFLIAGILLMVQAWRVGWSAFFIFVIGIVFLGIAWVTRPRFGELPSGILPRSDFPELYRLADDIAVALHTAPVDHIVIDEWFNAGFMKCGSRRRRVMKIGLPLWTALDDKERVALVAHEMGHSVNGDFNRSFYIETALNSLFECYRLIHPGYIYGSCRVPISPHGIATMPFILLLLGIANLCRWLAQGLIHLLWYESRRAEYLADFLAASIAGTNSAVSLLQKLSLNTAFLYVAREVSLSRNVSMCNLFDEFRKRIIGTPSLAADSTSDEQTPRLNVSHPPTSYRVRFLETQPDMKATVCLSSEQSALIDAELAQVQMRLQMRIIDIFKASAHNLQFIQ